jgi:NADH dehydrogenase
MRVAIIGGTGFVGGNLIDALLEAGHEPSLLVREGSASKVGRSERVRIVPGDISSQEALQSALDGCSAVIYNVGILREFPRRGITFEESQYQGLVRTVEAARNTGVRRLLLMSANGVKRPGTPYQETKRRAEEYATQSGLDVTVLRPSVIFGDPEGKMEFATQLFNDMIRPPIPAVSFFMGRDPEKEVLSWKEMIRRIAEATGKRKWILPMPTWIMRFGATLFDWLPLFPVTRGQLTMLEEGNTADPQILEQLIGRVPRGFTVENLHYLSRR